MMSNELLLYCMMLSSYHLNPLNTIWLYYDTQSTYTQLKYTRYKSWIGRIISQISGFSSTAGSGGGGGGSASPPFFFFTTEPDNVGGRYPKKSFSGLAGHRSICLPGQKKNPRSTTEHWLRPSFFTNPGFTAVFSLTFLVGGWEVISSQNTHKDPILLAGFSRVVSCWFTLVLFFHVCFLLSTR